MAGVHFSDPQGGKGAADRMATAAKSHIRIYINEGNDVTNATQMQDALLSRGRIEGVRVVALERPEEHDVSDHQKIPSISKLKNFRFIDAKILARRAAKLSTTKGMVKRG